MVGKAILLVAALASPVSRQIIKGPSWLNQAAHWRLYHIEKVPFPSKFDYSYPSPEFSAVLMHAAEAEEGGCTRREQIHLNQALDRALNFFAVVQNAIEMHPLDLFRVVLGCRGLPHGSIIIALRTARQSHATAQHFRDMYPDRANEYQLKIDMYQLMIEELSVLESVKKAALSRTQESPLD